jgi:tetratricopeptide (TPR) repeat protein
MQTTKPGRNEPCPCGSGRKYKKCCGQPESTPTPTPTPRSKAPQRARTVAPQGEGAQLIALLQQGRFGEVEAYARAMIEQQPANGAAWKALAVALQMQAKDALAATRRAAELLPSDAEAHHNLGLALLNVRQPEHAMICFRRSLTLSPSYVPAQIALGSTLQSVGRIAEAVECYRVLLRSNPGLAEVHSNLGHALWQLGRPEESALSCQRALQLNPRLAEAHSNLGNALLALGRPQEAEASYRQALAHKPGLLQAHINLAQLLRHQSRLQEAADCYARLLQLNPRIVEARVGLAHALVDMGRLSEALTSFQKALEFNPRLADAHNGLGNALVDLGRAEEAEASYRRALALQPESAEVHSNLAKALLEMDRVEESVACARRAVQLSPQLAEAHENLANALLNVNLEEAVAHYRTALRARPDDAELNNNLGVVLRLLGRTAEAEASCRRALELLPGYAPAVAALAEASADRGEFAEAERLFKQALALQPDASDAWVGLSRLRKLTRDDASWLEQAERLSNQSKRPREVVALRFAIGKYFDDIGEYDRAFTSYQGANELAKRHSRAYDRAQVRRQMDDLIARYDRPPEPVADAAATNRAVLIVGMPRSGTSLAEQILASHPDVFGAGELSFWHSASASLRAVGEFEPGAIRRFGVDYERLLVQLSADAQRVVDKMPTNFLELGLICSALPGTRIIHMQRDPIDTCLSIYFQDFRGTIAYANDLDDLAHFHKEYARLMDHWRRVLPAGVLLDVSYDALVEDQEHWTREMLNFIGLPWDARCLEFHQTQRSVVTASRWQVRQKISNSSVARWRHYESHIGSLLALLR